MADALSYFALLGVGEDVSQEELEAKHQELAEYLGSSAVPGHMREWAKRQAKLLDEAYAVLSDPERRAAVRKEQAATGKARQPQAAGKAKEERRAPAKTKSKATPESRPPEAKPILRGLVSQPLFLGAVMGLVVLAAILFGRYGFPSGDSGAEAVPEAQGEALATFDAERIAGLMSELQDDPQNPDILFELGETYFQGGQWQPSVDWFTKLVAVDPDNIHALTDIGTAYYNLGYYEEAKAAWLKVLEIDANDVQTHYNLGFLYANAEPQDIPAAMDEWQTVVRLDPESELATIAQAHLDGLQDGETQTQAPGTEGSGGGE